MNKKHVIDFSILFWVLLITLLYFFYRTADILTLLGLM